jgi:hypothetical protein
VIVEILSDPLGGMLVDNATVLLAVLAYGAFERLVRK